jgi:bacterial/archaeal transporter family-2 protein
VNHEEQLATDPLIMSPDHVIRMKAIPLLWLLALVSGAFIPVQAAANAALSRVIHGNVPFAAMTLFVIAALVTAIAVLATGITVPTAVQLREAPWWSYSGGLIVAFYVFNITFLAPRLGVGTAIALVVTGQVLSALAIDHFGLFRSAHLPLTPVRVFGGVLMIIGVVLALRK